jgi:hypothetical protein
MVLCGGSRIRRGSVSAGPRVIQMIDPQEVINELVLSKVAGVYSASHRMKFRCERTRADGVGQIVDVELSELRADENGPWFQVNARSGDGKMAHGNPERTIKMALSVVHWYELDK